MSDSDESSPVAKMVAAGVLLVIYGIYHHFATDNQQITNARVKNKYTKTRLVRRNKRTHLETDYYIETDKGTIKDEADIFELEFSDGDEYNDVQIGHVYDFKVNHDKVFDTNNSLSAKETGPGW